VTPREDSLSRFPILPRLRVPRAVWHTIGLVAAALVAYAIWRGYQAPDFVIDLSALRFC
jgi:hypothetical protein